MSNYFDTMASPPSEVESDLRQECLNLLSNSYLRKKNSSTPLPEVQSIEQADKMAQEHNEEYLTQLKTVFQRDAEVAVRRNVQAVDDYFQQLVTGQFVQKQQYVSPQATPVKKRRHAAPPRNTSVPKPRKRRASEQAFSSAPVSTSPYPFQNVVHQQQYGTDFSHDSGDFKGMSVSQPSGMFPPQAGYFMQHPSGALVFYPFHQGQQMPEFTNIVPYQTIEAPQALPAIVQPEPQLSLPLPENCFI